MGRDALTWDELQDFIKHELVTMFWQGDTNGNRTVWEGNVEIEPLVNAAAERIGKEIDKWFLNER